MQVIITRPVSYLYTQANIGNFPWSVLILDMSFNFNTAAVARLFLMMLDALPVYLHKVTCCLHSLAQVALLLPTGIEFLASYQDRQSSVNWTFIHISLKFHLCICSRLQTFMPLQ